MKEKIKLIVLAILFIVATIVSANYIANLLFAGKNSLETYESLKLKKIQLEQSIDRMQKYNAKLQKDYFELKNLEPEQ
ncbi:MAG TPA: septum formation initiator [Arcobacter sp.]|nr:septum formation initiator [Arcobacter sp.]HIP55508.1 septum formation initiator [Arcobacter sp.]